MNKKCFWCFWFNGEECTKNWQIVQQVIVQVVVEISANTHFDCPDFEFSYHQCQSCKKRSDKTCRAKSSTGNDDYFFHHINYGDMFSECEYKINIKEQEE